MIRKRENPYVLECFGIFLTGLLWYLGTSDPNSVWSEFQIQKVFACLLSLFTDPIFWHGIGASLERLLSGLMIAIVLGVPIGILTGCSNSAFRITYAPFQFLRVISPLAWTPLAIMFFGIGSAPARFLVAIAAIWPIIINTHHGVKTINQNWIEMVKSFGGSDLKILRLVVIRASFPAILTGIQLAIGVSWIVLVPAEMLGVSSGLGYMILDARDVNDYATVMALILSTGCLGLIIDLPIRYISRRFSW